MHCALAAGGLSGREGHTGQGWGSHTGAPVAMLEHRPQWIHTLIPSALRNSFLMSDTASPKDTAPESVQKSTFFLRVALYIAHVSEEVILSSWLVPQSLLGK